jgi:hypothetical protein
MMVFYELVAVTPALLFWIMVIILGSIMLGRGGGKAERLLIAGAGIKIVGNLISVPSSYSAFRLLEENFSYDYVNTINLGIHIVANIVGMAGIICLVYAFWLKFNTRRNERTVS